MEFTVLGGSPAWPNPHQAASGYLLERGDRRILIDCGSGIASVLRNDDPGPLTDIIISHFHADHWFDLVPLHFLYLYGAWHDRRKPALHLPPGGRDTVNLVASIWDGSIESFDRAFDVSEYDPDGALDLDDLHITFTPTIHYCTCYAMRIEAPDTTLAYTADTAPDEHVCRLVHGADLLVAEAALPQPSADDEGPRGHMAPEEAAQMAVQSEARALLLAHIPVENDLDDVRARAQAVYGGPVELAQPGLRHTFA